MFSHFGEIKRFLRWNETAYAIPEILYMQTRGFKVFLVGSELEALLSLFCNFSGFGFKPTISGNLKIFSICLKRLIIVY